MPLQSIHFLTILVIIVIKLVQILHISQELIVLLVLSHVSHVVHPLFVQVVFQVNFILLQIQHVQQNAQVVIMGILLRTNARYVSRLALTVYYQVQIVQVVFHH